ncbi:Calmodulin-binding transcription activator 4 [Sesamum angolense]|uniref:Calmodulin-binding transcription activator 4 n=1 Tax=Sesamum angolense TaxID=2727404 RepID=A0AAE1WUU7_9LAMI|nr:Calmodulin-binding transcription activator 4 [Sesamum angolense]
MTSINHHLVREAQTRWLKPVEVFLILQNYEQQQLTHQIPQNPPSGSLYLFNKRLLKFFRKDGHRWRRRRDQRTIAEAHERLKVGNVEALNCYYAHGEENSNFQRRSYWMLDSEYKHIVLVHYRDIGAALARGSIDFLDGTKVLSFMLKKFLP